MSTEKHTIAMAFLRFGVRMAQKTFQEEKEKLSLVDKDIEYFLQQFEQNMDQEVKNLLDKILDRKLI